MEQEHTTERLEYESGRIAGQEPEQYTPRPKGQIILAWILLAVVLFAIGGMAHWQMNGRGRGAADPWDRPRLRDDGLRRSGRRARRGAPSELRHHHHARGAAVSGAARDAL